MVSYVVMVRLSKVSNKCRRVANVIITYTAAMCAKRGVLHRRSQD